MSCHLYQVERDVVTDGNDNKYKLYYNDENYDDDVVEYVYGEYDDESSYDADKDDVVDDCDEESACMARVSDVVGVGLCLGDDGLCNGKAWVTGLLL